MSIDRQRNLVAGLAVLFLLLLPLFGSTFFVDFVMTRRHHVFRAQRSTSYAAVHWGNCSATLDENRKRTYEAGPLRIVRGPSSHSGDI